MVFEIVSGPARRRILVMVEGNHLERRGDVRAVGHGRRNRLVGAVAGRTLCGWKATPKGMARPPAPTCPACSSSLEANPGGWRCALASRNAWSDRGAGMVMHKPLLIPHVALSPIKPEGENPR